MDYQCQIRIPLVYEIPRFRQTQTLIVASKYHRSHHDATLEVSQMSRRRIGVNSNFNLVVTPVSCV